MSRLSPPVSPRDHAQGATRGAVTLVEYGDFECPHCGAAYPLVKQVQDVVVGNEGVGEQDERVRKRVVTVGARPG